MKTATVSKLKASISRYLKWVKAGDEVIVTERGIPVAKLVPILHSGSMPEYLREMENEGVVSVGTGKLPKNFWKLPRPKDPRGLVLKAVLEERFAQLLAASEKDIGSGRVRYARTFLKSFKHAKKITR